MLSWTFGSAGAGTGIVATSAGGSGTVIVACSRTGVLGMLWSGLDGDGEDECDESIIIIIVEPYCC